MQAEMVQAHNRYQCSIYCTIEIRIIIERSKIVDDAAHAFEILGDCAFDLPSERKKNMRNSATSNQIDNFLCLT